MTIKHIFNVLFPSPKYQEDVEKRQESFRKRIVALISRGNISLSNGRFLTAKKLRERKEELARHNF